MAHEIRILRLAGDQPFAQAVDEVDEALRQARADGVGRLLVDIRGLTGFASPDLFARISMVRRWASTAKGQVRVAMVARPDLMDGERFGVVVARSMGFDGDVFEHEEDALYWLEQTPSLWVGPPPEF